jgi:hypothetical protein
LFFAHVSLHGELTGLASHEVRLAKTLGRGRLAL